MHTSITIKGNPETKFELSETGFTLIDGETPGNNGFYAYNDVQKIKLNKVWFPVLVNILRYGTWLINGAPLVGEPWNKANLVILTGKARLQIWLTDSAMAKNTKNLVRLLKIQTTPKS